MREYNLKDDLKELGEYGIRTSKGTEFQLEGTAASRTKKQELPWNIPWGRHYGTAAQAAT